MTIQKDLFDSTERGANFSADGRKRYRLHRIWDASEDIALVIGLNPSTANGEKDDPTIRIITKALKNMGYGGFYMMNLSYWITPDPKEMAKLQKSGYGMDAEFYRIFNDTIHSVAVVIAAWGAFKEIDQELVDMWMYLLKYSQVYCFGMTKDGSPIHARGLNYIKDGVKNASLKIYKYGTREE